MHFLSRYDDLPAACDPDSAKTGLERWLEAAAASGDPDLTAFSRDLAVEPAGRRLLESVFGNSPFLTECLLAEPAFFRGLLVSGPDAVFERLMTGLGAAPGPESDTAGVMRELRVARRRAALLVALADIAGLWPLERVTGALSAFADKALQLATAHLLRQAATKGEIALPEQNEPQSRSGYFVLGMGKLGGEELNYSSDIDLIVLYDDERLAYTGQRSLQDCMVRVTRDLVRVMEERTEHGYVFRCDLRLRPDPGATPVALSVLAAETYYESMGQNWERAAMIKARGVAGDGQAAGEFLHTLVPYIWRKHLDFAAIDDIHSIKRQINAHRGGYGIKVAGHNLKLGRGGIREIEFFAQTQQLIWGGRMPELRTRRTCEAINVLAKSGRVAPEAAEELIEAYRFLRRAEHRLQMIDDRQTHTVPEDEAGLTRLAVFLGFADRAAFADALLRRLRAVERHYAALFEEAPVLSGPGNLVFTGGEPDPETLRTIANLGFENAATVSSVIMGWHHGRISATRSVRAREILTELVPALLQAFAHTAAPDQAFLKFDEFLSRLPAGVQLFSLFQANPVLLDLVAEIMGNAPNLADLLARRPILLDGVLQPDFYDPLPDAFEMESELRAAASEARGFEDILDIARRWAGDRKFRLGVQILRNITRADAAGPVFSDIADAVIRVLQPVVQDSFAKQHGWLPAGAMAVVAMGKLGGREMTVGSDLDLVFVYDWAPGAERSDGEKPLSPHDYFARLSRRLINALTAQTAEGQLYEVDMRLRPSGASGPIASSLEAFVRYQHDTAWTWEHLALTRARLITGPPRLVEAIIEVVRDVLTRAREPGRLAFDVADMRGRMARERGEPSTFDVKNLRGGLIDAEFIAQYLQLRHAHAHPEMLSTNTAEALRLAAQAGLIGRHAAGEIIDAVRLWQRIQGAARLCYRDGFVPERATEGARRVLVGAAEAGSFTELEERIKEVAGRVRAHFHELIEAAAVAPPEEETKP
ncbi:MAG: bifunctional [glutamine synthetase] adenylyltransferase/[glutamine synthetase]-adenylyl-L-tyrosine phosphorylase [Alphaproteobacteria bacterium]